MDDLASCWDEIHKMLVVQFGEIQGSFGRNKAVLEHKYKSIKMMRELEGYVSRRVMSKTASVRFYRSSKNRVSFRQGVMNLINF